MLLLRSRRTVCLYKLRDGALQGLSQPESVYKRFIRFFNHKKRAVLIQGLGHLIGHWTACLPFEYLSLDRTQWKFGCKEINLLVLAIHLGNCALPIAWLSLDKAGNSSQAERMRFFQNALKRYNLVGKTLLADREFIGQEWFDFLAQMDMGFIIRLRFPCYKKEVALASGKSYDDFLAQLGSKRKHIALQIKLNHRLYTFAARLNPNPKAAPEDRILIFISSWPPAEVVDICQTYRKRWKIECLFKHLKTNGFNLEDLHLKCDEKIELLFGLTAACYTLCLLAGKAQEMKKKTPIKRYAQQNENWPKISVFRNGLTTFEKIGNAISDLLDFIQEIRLSLLFRPKPKSVQ